MAREPVYSYEEIADFFSTYARNLQNLRSNALGIARSRAIREQTNLSAGDTLRESELQLEKINDLFDSMFGPLAAYRWHAKTTFYQNPTRGTTSYMVVIENSSFGEGRCRIGPGDWDGDETNDPGRGNPFERPYYRLPTFLAEEFGVSGGRWGTMFWPEMSDPYRGGDRVLIEGTGTAADGYSLINAVDPEGMWIELMHIPGDHTEDQPKTVTDMRITVEQRDHRNHMAIQVPDLVGLLSQNAQTMLSNLGLVSIVDLVTSAQPVGHVVAQDPAPSTFISFGGHVTIDVSTGET